MRKWRLTAAHKFPRSLFNGYCSYLCRSFCYVSWVKWYHQVSYQILNAHRHTSWHYKYVVLYKIWYDGPSLVFPQFVTQIASLGIYFWDVPGPMMHKLHLYMSCLYELTMKPHCDSVIHTARMNVFSTVNSREYNDAPNHRQLYWLFNRLLRLTSIKAPKLRILILFEGKCANTISWS